MIFKSPFEDFTVPQTDLWSLYMERDRPYPDDHTLLIESETDRSYTFANVRDGSITFGQGLKHTLGWSKGDVLAFFAPNNIDFPVVNFGLQWAGGIASPINPTYPADDVADQLVDSGAKALVTFKPFLSVAIDAANKAKLPLDRVFLMGAERDESGKFRHWTEITAKGAWITPKKTAIRPKKDLAYLVYSSGTTGKPKGVMLTHENMVASVLQSFRIDVRGLAHDVDAQIGLLPFFHIYGLSVVLNSTFWSGAKCVTMARFDLERFCQLIQKHAISFIYVPPPVVLALGKVPAVSKYDLSTVRWINSGAAPLGKELVEAVWKRLKIGVKQGYGLSETSPTITAQFVEEWWKFQGSVGKMYQNMSAKIVDPEGKELSVDEQGELLVKGPNVFPGYWKRPELQKDTFTSDGWYRTGDVAYFDKYDNLYITDRIKELIKYKGFQVAPAELEDKLLGRPDINDVCVIGVWDDNDHTEVPRAYVVLKPDAQESDELAEDIVQWLGAKVAPPKRLRGGVRFVKEVPKSASGKILRRLMRDQVKKEEAAATKAKL
jgi:4-coumarate--CoA ligase